MRMSQPAESIQCSVFSEKPMPRTLHHTPMGTD